MAKDPAFLFYSSDFLTGTALMCNEEVGIYIKLLCYQHQHGGLIDRESFDALTHGYRIVKTKFIECEDGFYNFRLMDEMARRSKKSLNLSANAQKRWELCLKDDANASQLHMPTENENENENNINKKAKKFQKPDPKEVADYFQSKGSTVKESEKFFDYQEAKGWVVGKSPMKDWMAAARTWMRNAKEWGQPEVKKAVRTVQETPTRSRNNWSVPPEAERHAAPPPKEFTDMISKLAEKKEVKS